MEKLKNIFKNKTLIFSILGFALVLTIAIGGTYAYFTTTMNGSAGTVSAITAKVGDVEFKASNIEANHIYPGWRSGEKTLEVTLGESDQDVSYVCFINTIKSEIKDIRLEVSGDNAVTLPNQKIETGLTEIARGTLSSGETAITTYELIFPELGTEQNYDMGKSINASISCTLNGTNQVFYSHGKQNFNAIGTDKEGNKLTIRTSIPEPSLAATQRQELSSSSLGLSEEEIKNVKLLNISVEEDFDEANITLNVSDIAHSGDSVAVYHFNGSTWEEVGIYTVDVQGTINPRFTSLSPVAIIDKTIPRCRGNNNTIECKVLADNPIRRTVGDNQTLGNGFETTDEEYTTFTSRASFSVADTNTNIKTLYTTNKTEDDSTVYYFAGDARNNWIVFGEYTTDLYDDENKLASKGDKICWRIIRTNEDVEGNGLRLLYSGVYDNDTKECGNTTTGYIGTSKQSLFSLANSTDGFSYILISLP